MTKKEKDNVMQKFFIEEEQIQDNRIYIQGSDVKHILNVLRLNKKEKIQICNKQTMENYIVEIEEIEKEKIITQIIEKMQTSIESNVEIHLYQGLPKADKMELIIQKCVELGVNEITPIEMKRCVVKIEDKAKNKKIERWQKISEVAAKQCGRDIIPKINNIINIKNICNLICEYDIVLLAYENEQENTLKNELLKLKNETNKKLRIGIIIGPEGGLDKEEVELLKTNGAKSITLGKRILRTETVAFVLTSIIMYELGDLGGVV